MPTHNDLYIDAVYVEGTASTQITNVLDGTSGLSQDIDTTVGYKFVIQLTNASNSIFNMGTTNVTLRFRTNYSNDSQGWGNINTDITITSGTIAAGEHYYIGWDGIVSGLATPDTTTSIYLADQQNQSQNVIVAGSLLLIYNGQTQDILVDNSVDVEESFVFEIFGETSNADGIFRRNPSGTYTAPSSSYDYDHWVISSTNFASYLAGSAAGDPHIKTLNGENYKFDYLGAFRLFEDYIHGNLIIINGLSEKGPGRWKEKQYIKKLFIQCNDKYMLVDMGFRGSPVKVIENNGIDYEEIQLDFNKGAKRYSFTSKFSTLDLDESVTDDLPALIRNEINILINNEKTLSNILSITLQNVNQYNLQPCRFSLNLSKVTKLAKGCIMDRKYAPIGKLDNIRSVERLKEPSLEEPDKIPELEIAPVLRNIQWQ